MSTAPLTVLQPNTPTPVVRVEVLVGGSSPTIDRHAAGVTLAFQNPAPNGTQPFAPSPSTTIEIRG